GRSVRVAAEVAAAARVRLIETDMSGTSPPVIDVSDLAHPATRKAIDAACEEWGFFQAVGHGIDAELMAVLREQMRAFFAQPVAAKQAIVRTAENPWGFYDRELTRHTPDWKQIYDYGPADGGDLRPQWPEALPAFKPAIQAFYDACDGLAMRM